MSATLAQIFALNPTTTIGNNDLLYLVQSPYTPGTDAGILGSDFKALFVGSSAPIAGTILRSNGSKWVASTSTFANTYSQNSILYASSANTVTGLSSIVRSVLTSNSTGIPTYIPLTDGQLIIGSTAGSPAAASLTAGSGVTITPGSNSITIAATGSGGTVTSISAGTGITLTPNPIVATGTIALTVPVTEVDGGTNQTTYTLGDTLYSSAANTLSKLPGNITAVKQYLSQTGTGIVSAAPSWATISGGDITGAALTKTDDTNVTLTLGGSPTTALLRATSLTLGWAGTLSGTRGGTGVNNGANTATFAGNLNFANSFTTSGNFAVTQTYTGITNVTFPTTGTLATTSQLLVSPLTTKGDIWVWSTTNDRLPVATGDGKILQVSSAASTGLAYSTPTYPSASGTSGKFLISDGTNNVYSTSTIPTSAGATANKVLLSDGTNYVLSTPTFPNASATLGKIIISDGTNWIASTPTYPATAGTSGNVLTSDGTNWNSSAPAAATATVITNDTTTNATMFPVWVTANTGSLPLKVSSTKLFYNPSTSLLTNIGSLAQITNIVSSTGANILGFNYVASAVNSFEIANGVTTSAPILGVSGTDSAIGITLSPKNSGVQLVDSTSTSSPNLTFRNAANTHGTSLTVATAQSTDLALTLPAIDGAASFPLVTSGAGVLSFAAIAAGAMTTFGSSGMSALGSVGFDLSTATGGTAVVNTLTFQPSLVIFFANVNGAAATSWGFDNGTQHLVVYNNGASVAATFGVANSSSVAAITSGTANQVGHITSFASNGFTITFTKTGSPTGSLSICYLAFK